jgi:broad specificity phosphatase PhoE
LGGGSKIAEVQRLEVRPLQGIIDMRFGEWEGQSLKDVQRKDGQRFQQWRNEPHRVRIPGGESLDEVRDRAMAVLEETIQSNAGKTLLFVSHRVVNKVILCSILGLDNSHFWQIGQDTTAINLIRHREGRYVLSLLNEACHLKGLQPEGVKVDF